MKPKCSKKRSDEGARHANERRIRWRTALCVSAFISAAAFATYVASSRNAASGMTRPVLVEQISLRNLLLLNERPAAYADIAIANLDCAAGLPGSEKLDVAECLKTLGEWAARVRSETEKHFYRFRQSPAEFNQSEAYFRMIVLVTVLQQDFGVRYNPERALQPDFKDSRDLFIHGLLGEARTGTCVSMPVLYVAIGRHLGYPLHLAQSRMHLYVRWEGKEVLNIEATSRGIVCRDDTYYANWPEPLTDEEHASGAYLRSLTPAEELAVFLNARGHCLEDNGRWAEAQLAYALARTLAPSFPHGQQFLAAALQKELGRGSRSLVRPGTIRDSFRWVDALNDAHRQALTADSQPTPSPHP